VVNGQQPLKYALALYGYMCVLKHAAAVFKDEMDDLMDQS